MKSNNDFNKDNDSIVLKSENFFVEILSLFKKSFND